MTAGLEATKTEAWEAAQRARSSALERDEAVATAGHLQGEVERLHGELRARAREAAALRGDLRALQEQANVRVYAAGRARAGRGVTGYRAGCGGVCPAERQRAERRDADGAAR